MIHWRCHLGAGSNRHARDGVPGRQELRGHRPRRILAGVGHLRRPPGPDHHRERARPLGKVQVQPVAVAGRGLGTRVSRRRSGLRRSGGSGRRRGRLRQNGHHRRDAGRRPAASARAFIVTPSCPEADGRGAAGASLIVVAQTREEPPSRLRAPGARRYSISRKRMPRPSRIAARASSIRRRNSG